MNERTLDIVTHDIARILQAIDEISLQADALADSDALGPGARSDAEARLALEAIAATLDRIVAQARSVETLVAAVPDPDIARDLEIPSYELRDAVTSLVVSAYGVATRNALPSPRFHPA